MRKLEAYIEEMASTDQISGSVNIQKIQDDVVKLWNIVKSQPEINEEQKNRIKFKALYNGVVRLLCKVPDSCPGPGVSQLSFVISVLKASNFQHYLCISQQDPSPSSQASYGHPAGVQL